jgi:putative heme iron utilization protein
MSEPEDRYQTFDEASLDELAALVAGHRQAVLATVHEGAPYTAMTAYVPEPRFAGVLLHLSDLSPHKHHLAADPRASLLVFEPDDGQGELMQRRRLTMACRAEALAKGTPEYERAQAVYLERLPGHRMMFDLADFGLVRLVPEQGLLIAGFGRAYRVSPADLAAAAERAAAERAAAGLAAAGA